MVERPSAIPVLIDTDCGIDDALALIVALRSSDLDVRSIVTVAGNAPVDSCTQNVLRICSLLEHGTKPRVVRGSAKPLRRKLITAPEVHGQDGLGDVATPRPGRRGLPARSQGPDALIKFCRAWEARGTIIALGPLTNVARAWNRAPHDVGKIGRIISMGGAFHSAGNTGPVAEFNYFVDPEAAQTVVASGLPVDIIPLDITQQVTLLRSELEERVRRSPGRLSSFIARMTQGYMHYHELTEGFLGGYLHDPIAVAAAARPSWFEFAQASVAVETEGRLTRGMSVRFRALPALHGDGTPARTGAVRVAQKFDREQFLAWFHDHLWRME